MRDIDRIVVLPTLLDLSVRVQTCTKKNQRDQNHFRRKRHEKAIRLWVVSRSIHLSTVVSPLDLRIVLRFITRLYPILATNYLVKPRSILIFTFLSHLVESSQELQCSNHELIQ